MPLREYAQHRGFTVQAEYTDVGVNGVKDRRPGLDRLMKAARAREIDAVLVARFDRFARSTSHLVRALEEFQSLGVEFISLNESVDTSTPIGKMVFTVLGAVAELERNIIIERIKAGVSRARKQDKSLGRPKAILNRDKVLELHQEGLGVRKISDLLGVNRETVRKTINISLKDSWNALLAVQKECLHAFESACFWSHVGLINIIIAEA
jgi:DNA invertase Pin-like site-specific DNA recombinase